MWFICSYPCITCIWAFVVVFGFSRDRFFIDFVFGVLDKWFGRFTFQVNHVLEVLMFWIWFWLWGCTCRFVCTWPRLVFRVPMYIRIHARGFMFVGACLYIYRCIYIYMCVYGFISMICFDWVFTCRARVIHVSHAMFTFPLSFHVNIYLSYRLHASCLSC